MTEEKIHKIISEILTEDQIEFDEISSFSINENEIRFSIHAPSNIKTYFRSGPSGAEIYVKYTNAKRRKEVYEKYLITYNNANKFKRYFMSKPKLNLDSEFTYRISNGRILKYLLNNVKL